ncbi:type 1 glutamine amidotransferase domain-containing protein [Herbaspirillum sp. GCM10030257]|uniref:type 1 glutamine amidotransferase domain-containing protein n=1 Tax=Herbaspirillum sp. GCM10030257 TaxID=3273393 RepID=UPI003616617D
MTKKILIVITSHNRLGNTGRRTGFHYEELATPFRRFHEAGFSIQIASLKGGLPPHDPSSLELLETVPDDVVWFRADQLAMALLGQSSAVSETDFSEFDAVFFPGGHGAVFDLPYDKVLTAKLGKFFDAGKLIGAVCHGPSVLLNTRGANGLPIVEGLRVNAFTNAEETAVQLTGVVPVLLEDGLREQGARYVHGGLWESFAVRDKNLVTGQNPQSAARVAELMIEVLLEK